MNTGKLLGQSNGQSPQAAGEGAGQEAESSWRLAAVHRAAGSRDASRQKGREGYIFFFIMENYFKLLQKGTKWSDFLPDSQQDYCLYPHPGNSEAFPPDCSDQRCLGAAGRTRAELGKINTHPHPGCDCLLLLPSTHAMARLQPPGRTQKSHDKDIT